MPSRAFAISIPVFPWNIEPCTTKRWTNFEIRSILSKRPRILKQVNEIVQVELIRAIRAVMEPPNWTTQDSHS